MNYVVIIRTYFNTNNKEFVFPRMYAHFNVIQQFFRFLYSSFWQKSFLKKHADVVFYIFYPISHAVCRENSSIILFLIFVSYISSSSVHRRILSKVSNLNILSYWCQNRHYNCPVTLNKDQILYRFLWYIFTFFLCLRLYLFQLFR